MKKIVAFSALAAVAVAASAQEQGRVLSATPVVQQVAIPQQVCGNETVYSGSRNSGAGAVLGAIAGGAAGNAIGRGSGRAAATAIGVIGGAVIGNQIEGNGQPQYQNVQRCTTETYYENRTVGYDVVYEYAGRQYTTRTQNDPGRWIPVSVQPAAQPAYSSDPYAGERVYSQPGVVTSTYSTYPQQPVYQQPPAYAAPAVVIEYGYDRRPYHRHGDPYWR
ncbi:MAG: glycine zipper 2TM domain-containing protein [Acidovorax sp.]|uniref:glycine zipper 2TM domain-containing protein n=1 Tax=Acidovorax sp. TaxID=1872122 RepID=UPI0039E5D6FF